MKKFLSVLLAAVMMISALSVACYAQESDTALKFNDDGTFRIMQISDIQDGPLLMTATSQFMKDVVEEYQPDLIVLTGDNISGGSCTTKGLTAMAIDRFMSIFEKAEVPVAMVFGNHDTESLANKEDQMKMYERYDCFVGCEGEDLTGCGNYNLPILSSDGEKIAYNIWCIDSLTYNRHPESFYDVCYYENDLDGYACVHKDQIDWYVETSNELKQQNGGKPVPSMMFQHIIVPEVYDALVNENGTWVLPEGVKGNLHEDPCPPHYSNGQFDAIVNQGDVVAMFFGHDHKNSFELPHKGVDLVNTPGVGFSSYGDEGRGVRIIDINENDTSTYETEVVTWLEYYDAENNRAAMNHFIYSGNEFEAGEQVAAFFKYIYFSFVDSVKAVFSIFG